MLAIDWSHTRDFAIFDGKEAKIIPLNKLIDEAKKSDMVVIESGAPLSVLYSLCRLTATYTIDTQQVAHERESRGFPKWKSGIQDDLIDAKIIFDLAQSNKGRDGFIDSKNLESPPARGPLKLDDDKLRLVYLYHQFLYTQRAWLKTQQIQRAVRRHFGDADNATLFLLSCHEDEYKRRLESLRKEIEQLAPNPPDSIAKIKGMSKWLWAGIVITADPRLFPTKSAYRKYLGLMDRDNINHKFNRNARRAYWLVIDQFIKHNTPAWRELYDEYKERLATRDGYTHPHGGALNRVATKFADFVWSEIKEKGIIHQAFLW